MMIDYDYDLDFWYEFCEDGRSLIQVSRNLNFYNDVCWKVLIDDAHYILNLSFDMAGLFRLMSGYWDFKLVNQFSGLLKKCFKIFNDLFFFLLNKVSSGFEFGEYFYLIFELFQPFHSRNPDPTTLKFDFNKIRHWLNQS